MAVDVRPDAGRILKALVEPLRWEIVERLAGEELCVCHLVEDLGVAQPLVSHHLRVLREAGLVDSQRHRQWVYYRLRPEALEAVAGAIGGLASEAGRHEGRRRPCS